MDVAQYFVQETDGVGSEIEDFELKKNYYSSNNESTRLQTRHQIHLQAHRQVHHLSHLHSFQEK